MHFLNRRFAAFCFAGLLWTAALPARGQVAINEVMADNDTIAGPDGSVSDWVELYNPGTAPVSLQGWSLTDTSTNPRRWVFPNISLAARAYLVVILDSDRPATTSSGGALNAGFSLKSTGDNIALYNPQSILVDSLRFGPQAVDFSIGAIPSGSDTFVLTTPTPGSENIAQPLGAPLGLRINEWMADPSTGEDWFEIYNPGSLPVALFGLYFVDSNLEPSPVAALSFIGTGKNAFLRFFADNSSDNDEVNFGLGANGDSIGLYTSNGTRIHNVVFGRQVEDQSQGSLPDGSDNYQALSLATPGGSNLVLYEGLWVNEILTHTDPPYEDAVEFYNNTAAPIDIGGWFLSNSRSELKKYRIPAGTIVPSKGYLVIYQNQFNGASASIPFTFDSASVDQAVLSQADAAGALSGKVVEVEFQAAERNISFGRYQPGATSPFVPLVTPTFGVDQPASVEQFRAGTGAPNAAPKIGPVVISEIMYNPSTNTATADSPSDPEEFIELTNISSEPVTLYDPDHATNVWKITGGVTFNFPLSSTIPPSTAVLVVSFDPAANATQLAAFRTKYSVPAGTVIYGPFTGKLNNSGETISLQRPDEPEAPPDPDAGFVPYLLVDQISYTDSAPWPSAADGLGQSLQRKSLPAFGNDPVNWQAAAPTAGQSPAGADVKIQNATYANGTITITATATPGRNYSLQYRNDLSPGTLWRTLNSATASGNTVTISDTSAGPLRFYRISAN